MFLWKEGTQAELNNQEREDEQQDPATVFAQPRQARDKTFARLTLQPAEEWQGDQGESEQKTNKPQVEPPHAKPPGTEAGEPQQERIEGGISSLRNPRKERDSSPSWVLFIHSK